MKFLECVPGTNPETGEWACAVCDQPGSEDCIREKHLATDENLDRLAYAYQAVGPDEFPFGYYRVMAEEHIIERDDEEYA